jgi:hypothetical protein
MNLGSAFVLATEGGRIVKLELHASTVRVPFVRFDRRS